MPTRIIEFGPSDVASMGGYPVVPRSFVAKQTAFTATTSPHTSNLFNPATVLICIDTDEQVYVDVGAAPSVTTDNLRIAAGDNQWFEVTPGGSWTAQVRT